ncbi:STAS domain-containing protein [Ideonella azotifigens]|uniref:STAS domain-containing protein n=1 Tax=Ideonella azotifigens TaxID=513160 RepID=A0ABN1KK22_9BURK|nr:STAS domain-containing protein [Ideonella azotifigens]MCD2339302.1 STAS domain-containing protein [Ideonella azotifigens]
MQDDKGLAWVLRQHESKILQDWTGALQEVRRHGSPGSGDTQAQARSFLAAFAAAIRRSSDADMAGTEWDDVRALLTDLSRDRAVAGFSPTETATFVFSLKQPLFVALRESLADDPKRLSSELWAVSLMLDKLGLFSIEAYQNGREQVIERQHQELLDLSTPVVELWQGILALPLIGTLDSERTQTVMESLLEAIVEKEATVAILDITGVPTVDTLVAQHLMKTVAAARLMGAECIISGIRPQIAQTIVHLGVNLDGVITKATLAGALQTALRKTGQSVQRAEPLKVGN